MYQTSNQTYGSGVVTRQKGQIVKQSNNFQPSKIGIENIGNTCYINSMLQCLINTPAIHSILQQPRDNRKTNELFKQFYVIWFRIQTATEPEHEEIVQFKQLLNQHKDFDNFNQQDCIEFFHVFLDLINAPFLIEVFRGELTHQIICQNCQTMNRNTENFINISIYIAQAGKLSQMIADYFKPEQVNSQQNCLKCNKKSPLNKKTHLSTSPQVLVIQLKRYDSRQVRSNNAISIEQSITLKGFCDEAPTYKLYAVINHQGYSIYSGHYTCLIKTSTCWFHYNDSRVSEYPNKVVEDELSKSQNSYVLFYQKQ